MRIALAFPVLNQHELAKRAIKSFSDNANEEPPIIIYDNGSDSPFEYEATILRSANNIGVPAAMNQILKYNESHEIADFIAFFHTDVIMYEQGWDTKLKQALTNDVGVAGYFGAKGIGTADIYKTPYVMQQLARQAPVSGSRCRLDNRVHGQRLFQHEVEPVAVLDGFSLVVHKDLRFNESYGLHHSYDNDICLRAHNQSKNVICLNCNVDHIGGQTDVNEDWTKGTGKTKQQVHEEAHRPLYEEWRPGRNNISLPFWVT